MSLAAAATRTVASVVNGSEATDAPGGRLQSRNPARLDDVVAEVLLADADTFVRAARAARAAQSQWARVPAPARGRASAQAGRPAQPNKEARSRLATGQARKT